MPITHDDYLGEEIRKAAADIRLTNDDKMAMREVLLATMRSSPVSAVPSPRPIADPVTGDFLFSDHDAPTTSVFPPADTAPHRSGSDGTSGNGAAHESPVLTETAR